MHVGLRPHYGSNRQELDCLDTQTYEGSCRRQGIFKPELALFEETDESNHYLSPNAGRNCKQASSVLLNLSCLLMQWAHLHPPKYPNPPVSYNTKSSITAKSWISHWRVCELIKKGRRAWFTSILVFTWPTLYFGCWRSGVRGRVVRRWYGGRSRRSEQRVSPRYSVMWFDTDPDVQGKVARTLLLMMVETKRRKSLRRRSMRPCSPSTLLRRYVGPHPSLGLGDELAFSFRNLCTRMSPRLFWRTSQDTRSSTQ